MLIHTDQKPYQCDQCDQSFRQKQLLRRHQNLYHNPNYVPPPPREKTHECPECGRAFRHKGNLIRHMAVHDPESSAQEKALALKLGRQKKIQVNTNYLSFRWLRWSSVWHALVPKFAGSNPAEVVGFFGHLKNPPHAFFRRGSERICPMSQLCGM